MGWVSGGRPGSPLGAIAPGESRTESTRSQRKQEERRPKKEDRRKKPTAALSFFSLLSSLFFLPLWRPTIMRIRLGASLVVALAGLFGAATTAAASHCGAATYNCCSQPQCDAQCCFSSCQQ